MTSAPPAPVPVPAAATGPQPEPALRVRALTKTFGGGRALDSVDLEIVPGEVHALLGENGSGKSTLIKVLSGYHRPDAGSSVEIAGRALPFGSALGSYELGARFVHQDLGLVEASSIGDNLAFGPGFPTRLGTIRARVARQRARRALEEMELDADPRDLVASLSPAQKTGVAVARALLADDGHPARLLVLDEPTARLPEEEVEHLLEIVRTVARRGIGVLYVTHRLDEVFEVATTATVLRDGRKVATEPVAGLTRDVLLHQLLGAALEKAHRLEAEVHAEPGVPALSVTGLVSEVLREVSLVVRPGEVVGLAGITGSGRDALCATLFGARPRDGGTVVVGERELPAGRPDLAMARGVAYVPAERKLQGCFVDLSARENIGLTSLRALWKLPRVHRGAERAMARRWFDRFAVRPVDGVELPLSSFSGGNQQKVVFGKWFQREPVLFLLDEPTQGVDVGAKAELHRALFDAARAGAAVLMSSSDVDELVTTCDRVVVLRGGRVVASLSGSDLTVHALSRASLGISHPPSAAGPASTIEQGATS